MHFFLKRIKSFIRYRIFYSDHSIVSSAYIHPDVFFSERVTVGAFASVANSKLGTETKVLSHCSLSQVVTEQNVIFYDHGSFSNVEVGSYSYIAEWAKMSMTKVGRFCSIGPYLICGYGDHPVDWISTSPVFFSTYKQCGVSFSEENLYEERKPITIGNDVWIGARVFIRDGVTIGNGAIIAAGAVVVKDVPDYAIVGGVPAKVVRYRFDGETIQRLLDSQWWNWNEIQLREAQPYFTSDDISGFINRSLRKEM